MFRLELIYKLNFFSPTGERIRETGISQYVESVLQGMICYLHKGKQLNLYRRWEARVSKYKDTHKGIIAWYTFSTSFLKLLLYKNAFHNTQIIHQEFCWLTLLKPSHFPAGCVTTHHIMCFTFQSIGFDQYFEEYQTPIQRILKGFSFPLSFLYRNTHRGEVLWSKWKWHLELSTEFQIRNECKRKTKSSFQELSPMPGLNFP